MRRPGPEPPSFFPTPTNSVCRALENMGGWSKYFKMSFKTYDEYHVVAKERSHPEFWTVYARALADEQLGEAVKQAERVFLRKYGHSHKLAADKNLLRHKLAGALLSNGWKPDISIIKKEVAAIKRQRREEIAALKASLPKRRRKKNG